MIASRLGSTSLPMDVILENCVPGESGTALVTGGNQGLGLETAMALAKAGCRVIISSRDLKAGEKAAAQIRAAANCAEKTVVVLQLDLTDLASVKAFVHGLRDERLDIIVCNAGVMTPPYTLTQHNFELQMATNHHGHFYLMQLLTHKLKTQPFKSRLVMVSSAKHHSSKGLNLEDLHYHTNKKAYSPMQAYGDSKLANILFAKEYDRRHSNTNAFSVDPGRCPSTNLSRYTGVTGLISNMAFRTYSKPSGVAAATILYASVSRDLATGMGGAYLENCRVTSPSRAAEDPDLARRLWEVTSAEIETALSKSHK